MKLMFCRFFLKKSVKADLQAKIRSDAFQWYVSRSHETSGAKENAPIPEPQTAIPVASARLLVK